MRIYFYINFSFDNVPFINDSYGKQDMGHLWDGFMQSLIVEKVNTRWNTTDKECCCVLNRGTSNRPY